MQQSQDRHGSALGFLCIYYRCYFSVYIWLPSVNEWVSVMKQSKNGVVWEFWMLVRKLKEKQYVSIVTSVSSKHGTFLEKCFLALLGRHSCEADRSEFTSAVVILMPLWKNTCLPQMACLCNYTLTRVSLLNSQNINSLSKVAYCMRLESASV